MTTQKKFNGLNEAFNIEAEPISTEIEKVVSSEIEVMDKSIVDQAIKDLEVDYKLVRSTMTNIMLKGSEALDNILELAQETDSARAYEVVGQLLDKVSTNAEKLLALHQKMKEIKEGDRSNSPTNVTNNAVFVGSTTEAIKMIKAQLKEVDSEDSKSK